jgi:hypothetical protein
VPPPKRHPAGGRGGRRFSGGPRYGHSPVSYEETVILDTPDTLDVIFIPPTWEPEFKTPGAGMTFFENDDDSFLMTKEENRMAPHRDEAGDILPTFVTPDDAKHYLSEIDASYQQLDTSIQNYVNTPTDFKVSWGIQLATWKAFYVTSTASVGWLNTTAVMQQADRYAQQLQTWRANFTAIGGTPAGPAPLPPGQGIPGAGPQISDLTKPLLIVGGIAALLIFGPNLSKLI